MRLQVETLVQPEPQFFAGWAVSPQGNPVLVLVVGSQRVRCEMSLSEAQELGCCAIFAARQIAAQVEAAADPVRNALVGPDGVPLNPQKGTA